ncbi:MAG: NAD(P)/FAD-dependent oxidoreductase [Bacteroidetes bacterium]|nr:NAD(P)/FAD-dependent oxidoreductase [Bacteroidota bacterium]
MYCTEYFKTIIMKVVILGGGFGGLKLANDLRKQREVDITLIDRFNFHQFQPLFYQVATCGLDASNISFPLRKAFQKDKNVHIRMATVQEINFEKKEIITDVATFPYEILVIATGADTNYFGNKQLIENTYPMKSTVEALQIKYRLLQNIEDAIYIKDENELERLLTVVIVGGGPTGVEMSGAIADMRRFVLPRDYPEINFKEKMKIFLLEGSPELLGPMSDQSSEQSKKYLERLGVHVWVNTIVQEYDGKKVTTKDGRQIDCGLVVWAAGVVGNVPAGINKEITVRGNRIKVDRYNQVSGLKDVYAIGDVSYMETPQYPHGHPQVASVPIAQAIVLAKNLKRQLKGKTVLEEFEYHDKGSMATVGRNLAVVDIPKPHLHLGGFPAWVIWMTLHLWLLLGVKNKFAVFGNWIYNYVTYDNNFRLIFRAFKRSNLRTDAAAGIEQSTTSDSKAG